MKRKNVFKLISLNLIFIIVFCISAEIIVRILMPDILLLGIDENFFAQKRFGATFSFKPNIQGYLWDKKFTTDKFGFPQVSRKPITDLDSKILLLGDSLSFPIGANPEECFVFQLEKKLKNCELLMLQYQDIGFLIIIMFWRI